MDYEKKYKEALKRAREALNDGTISSNTIAYLQDIFPELKESKDNRIMKVIRGWIYTRQASFFDNGISKEEILAWLEKQGKLPIPKLRDINEVVEPKFHEGDWVVSGRFVTQIREIAGDGYVNSHNGFISFEGAKYYHLWTIQDARDGDVLFHSDSASNGIFIFKEIIDKGFAKEVICYCDYDSEDGFCLGEKHTCCWTNSKILHPATKEQRDTLFAKMKEAGCIFDFERKELKKLGQPEVTKTSDQEEIAEIPFGAKDSELQEATYYIPKGFHAEIEGDKVVIKKGEKPTAWSKKDEKMFEYALNMIEWYSGKNEDKSRYVSDWLKSLKQRIGG